MFETRKFVMATLHWKEGLLCDKKLSQCFFDVSAGVCVSIHPSGFVRTITLIFMHGFQNNVAELFSLIRISAV